jgi:nicotinamidase-related amidase
MSMESLFLSAADLEPKVAAWTAALGIEEEPEWELRAPALLVLDMQNEFLTTEGQLPVWGGPAIIPRVKSLVETFRRTRQPVVFTRHVCIEPFAHASIVGVMRAIRDPASFLPPEGPSTEIHSDLRPSPEEYVITKYRYSAFYGSPLETILRIAGIREVVITGVATNICCEATAHDAFFRGFDVLFAVDGTGGIDEASHLATLRTIQAAYGRLVTMGQMQKALTRIPPRLLRSHEGGEA